MAEDLEEVVPKKYLATLVRGECHYLRDIRFDHGVPTVIEEHHKTHLEEHAIDVVQAAGFDAAYDDPKSKIETRPKFTFSPYDGPLDAGITVGLSSRNRDDKDRDAAERLRSFNDKEALRMQRMKREAPQLDPETRRAEIERAEDPTEPTAAPRARPPRFPRTAA